MLLARQSQRYGPANIVRSDEVLSIRRSQSEAKFRILNFGQSRLGQYNSLNFPLSPSNNFTLARLYTIIQLERGAPVRHPQQIPKSKIKSRTLFQ
jgi:hypothetical protein